MKTTEDGTLAPIHPGELLKEEFLDPLGITEYRLAKAIGVPQTRISEIIKGRRRITADTALRLSRYLGLSSAYWINAQAHYDLETSQDTIADALQQITPIAS